MEIINKEINKKENKMEDLMNIMQQMHLQFNSEIWLVVIPVILMAIDILTGYLSAWKMKEIKSQKMRDGVSKKVAEICYIVIGFVLRFAKTAHKQAGVF